MDDYRAAAVDEKTAAQQPTLIVSIRRFWWVVVPIVVGFVALGILFDASQAKDYQAASTLIIDDARAAIPFAVSDGGARSNQASERHLADQVEILRSSDVANGASKLLDGEFSGEEMLLRRDISGDLISNRITISFNADSPEAAVRGSDAIANAYVEVRQRTIKDTANAALGKVDTLLAGLQQTIEDLGRRIEILESSNEDRREVEQQLEDARTKLAILGFERDAAPLGSEERANLNTQIDELLRDLQAWEIILRVEQPDPELTALIVERDAAIAEHASLTSRRNSIAVDAEVIAGGVALFSPAQLPENPSGFSLDLILVAAVALGVALATAIAYSLSSRKEPELLLDAPMLGEVPALRPGQTELALPILEAPDSTAAEAFRFIASAISGQQQRVLSAGEEPARILAVSSAVAGDGRPMVTANTVIAFAQEGHRVLVMDADFDRQGVTSLLAPGRKPTMGLTEVIEKGIEPMETIVRIQDVRGHPVIIAGRGAIDLMARGGRGSAAPFLFKQPVLATTLEKLREEYDLVVIDSPPLLEVAYAGPVIDLADATLAVVARGQGMGTVREFGDQLDLAAAPVVGYVYDLSNISLDTSRLHI